MSSYRPGTRLGVGNSVVPRGGLASLPMVRLQLPIPSAFTHGLDTTKELVRGLYWAALPLLAINPFQALNPLWDSEVSL